MMFDPTANLAASTDYDIGITTGAKDVAGNVLSPPQSCPSCDPPFHATFVTAAPDSTSPTLTVDPDDGATDLLGQNVVVTFSETMNRSVTQAAFGLRKEGTTTKLGGAFTWNADSTQMTFNRDLQSAGGHHLLRRCGLGPPATPLGTRWA